MRAAWWCIVAGLAAPLITGCGPSAEERKAIAVFNQMDELIQHGGYVKKLEKFEKQDDRVFVIEAEIVNEQDVPIGLLHSERVEGFGTTKPRVQWYKTPGVREEWVPQRRRGRRDGGEGRGRGERQEQQQNQEQPAQETPKPPETPS